MACIISTALLVVCLGLAPAIQARTLSQVALSGRAAGLGSDTLSQLGSSATQAQIQMAASGAAPVSHATATGSFAAQAAGASVGINALAGNADLRSSAMQSAAQSVIGQAAGGGANPAAAVGAITSGVQIGSVGHSTDVKAQASLANTQDAIRSGNAVHGTSVGAMGTSIASGQAPQVAGLAGLGHTAQPGVPSGVQPATLPMTTSVPYTAVAGTPTIRTPAAAPKAAPKGAAVAPPKAAPAKSPAPAAKVAATKA